MSEYTLLKIQRFEDGVALVTLDRPPLNLMSPDMLYEVRDALVELGNDDTMRCIVLTGSQRAFCAGADVGTFKTFPRDMNTIIGQNIYNSIENVRVPIIAAIEGHCLGGGLELALCCDIRYASETAKIALTEANLSLIAAYGGMTRLPWLIGEANAKLMFYTAARLSGQEAKEMGLVQKVCKPEELIGDALELAHLMATKAPRSLAAAKQVFHQFREELFAAGMRREDRGSLFACRCEDGKEGIAALKEKRQPQFKNR
jgi:enoyl-CoA hydratase